MPGNDDGWIIATLRSLRLDAGLADHLGPALGLFPLEFRHVLRASADGGEVYVAEAHLVCGLVGDVVDRAIELRDDRRWRLGRGTDGIPRIRDEARHADLDQSRDVRQDIQPAIGCNRKNSRLAT